MGYIYLICDPNQNVYKIGVTKNLVQDRIKKLQTGNASELHIIHTIETEYPFRLETMLHNKFKDKKVHGEWYSLSQDDITNFKNICNSFIDMIDSMKQNPYFMKNIK